MGQFAKALEEMKAIARKRKDSVRGGKMRKAAGAGLPTLSAARPTGPEKR